MFINKDSLLLNSTNIGQYLVEVEYGYNKLWGDDTGRDVDGNQSGTFKGIFPKLRLTFRDLTQAELELLAPIFDASAINCTYYDPVLKRAYTMSAYTGDWSTRNRNTFVNVIDGNEGCQISVIANNKRPNS